MLQSRFDVPGATVYHPKEDRFTILIDARVVRTFGYPPEPDGGLSRQGELEHSAVPGPFGPPDKCGRSPRGLAYSA